MKTPLSRAVSTDSGWICAQCRSQYARKAARRIPLPSKRGLSTTASEPPEDTRYWKRTAILPEGPARTRFAPSPTGYLHIGGLRTALFSYLLARRTKGQFLLRIEDTDQKRLIPDAEERICADLRWAGLEWDEGPGVGGSHGPYRQSERNEIYQKHAKQLLDERTAYRCFCTPQTAGEAKAAYVTSGCYQNCSSLSAEEATDKAESKKQSYTVRLRVPEDAHKRVYPDLVYGKIQRLKRSPSGSASASEDDASVDASDTILVKSNGVPTYHFANVVDDHLMGITHVIRGTEWAASTPLHYDIYSAFDWKPPAFAHVGLLVDENKAKLSKRNSDLALNIFSLTNERGILPTPLVNFLTLLGWSNPTESDVMDLRLLTETFDLKFTKGNTMVKMDKLWFLQKAHAANQAATAAKTNSMAPITDVVDTIVTEVKTKYPHMREDSEPRRLDQALRTYCGTVLLADSKNFQGPKLFLERTRYFFEHEPSAVPAEREYYNKAQSITAEHLRPILHDLLAERWNPVPPPKPPRQTEVPSRKVLVDAQSLRQSTPLHSDHIPPICALETSIQHHLARAIWRTVFSSPLPVRNERQPPEGTFRSGIDSYLADSPVHHFWPLPSGQRDDPANAALMVALTQNFLRPRFKSDGESEKEVEERERVGREFLITRYKELNNALMRYLRERLCAGLPGPHASLVLAVLGMEECARRLSVDLTGDGEVQRGEGGWIDGKLDPVAWYDERCRTKGWFDGTDGEKEDQARPEGGE